MCWNLGVYVLGYMWGTSLGLGETILRLLYAQEASPMKAENILLSGPWR